MFFWSYVITQGICNKFIEVYFCVGCMVWRPNCLYQDWKFVKYWWDGLESVVAKSVWLKISRKSHIQFYLSCSTSWNEKTMITSMLIFMQKSFKLCIPRLEKWRTMKTTKIISNQRKIWIRHFFQIQDKILRRS